ncbi:hypothetical protein CCR75_004244 [Bremia lactucae]|uniref:Uncharacterized protein n=1 Tax=Bremia lactucae TaxID=4779 RepID=A0A976FQI9_BRELC|nr:hypothetical protein CCR75_004244 [Bremia lactucae]
MDGYFDKAFTPVDDEEGDGEPITKANKLELFDKDLEGLHLNPYRFDQALERTAKGLSFRQTASITKQH